MNKVSSLRLTTLEISKDIDSINRSLEIFCEGVQKWGDSSQDMEDFLQALKNAQESLREASELLST